MRSIVTRTPTCVRPRPILSGTACAGPPSPDLLLAGSIDHVRPNGQVTRPSTRPSDGGAAMSHYKSNLRDIEFNLFEVLRRQDLLGQPPYPDLDEETARGILDELERLATGPLAESFADADRNPPVFDPATHTVKIPESLRKSSPAFIDADGYRP